MTVEDVEESRVDVHDLDNSPLEEFKVLSLTMKKYDTMPPKTEFAPTLALRDAN